MTPPVDTTKLRELMAKATPGPWRVGEDEVLAPDDVDVPRGFSHLNTICDMRPNDDAELIVALVNAAPALLDELDASRAVVEAARTFESGRIHPALDAYDRARGGQ